MRRTAVFVVAASLTACAAGPDYVRPELPEHEAFVRAESAAFNSAEAESAFWRRLDDPLLARLIDHALTANHDLRIGLARLDQARALLGISNLDLDAQRSQLEAEDELAQSRTRAATAVIALYKALAGGWPERSAKWGHS